MLFCKTSKYVWSTGKEFGMWSIIACWTLSKLTGSLEVSWLYNFSELRKRLVRRLLYSTVSISRSLRAIYLILYISGCLETFFKASRSSASLHFDYNYTRISSASFFFYFTSIEGYLRGAGTTIFAFSGELFSATTSTVFLSSCSSNIFWANF